MDVKSNIMEFPLKRVSEAEFEVRAQRAVQALLRGHTDIGPLIQYGPHKERLSLMLWAANAGAYH